MKRFDLSDDCEGESGRCLTKMVESEDGDYVLFEDVAGLKKKLESALEILRPQCRTPNPSLLAIREACRILQ